MKPSNDREAIGLIIDGLVKAGCTIHSVTDAEEEEFAFKNKEQALDDLMTCDDGSMKVILPNGDATWAWFVFGNDPEEVLADCGISLSPYVDPIIKPWWE